MGRLILFAVEGTLLLAAGIFLVGLAQWGLKKLNQEKKTDEKK